MLLFAKNIAYIVNLDIILRVYNYVEKKSNYADNPAQDAGNFRSICCHSPHSTGKRCRILCQRQPSVTHTGDRHFGEERNPHHQHW